MGRAVRPGTSRALVVDPDASFAREVGQALSGFDVRVLTDGAEALRALRADRFDLVVSEWLLPSVDGLSLLRCVRGAGSSAPFVVCTVLGQPEARDYAMRMGATQFVAKPVAPATLARAARGSPRASTGIPALDALCATSAWRDAGATLRRSLVDGTGLALREEGPCGPEDAEECSVRATLGMIDVAARIELEVGLFTSIESAAALVAAMLRPQDDVDAAADLLAELCNQTLGALKSALWTAGLAFTLAVPERTFVPLLDDWLAQFPARRTLCFGGGGVRLVAAMGARPSASRAVDVGDLRENMVLTEDVVGEKGVVVPAGTRLTGTTIAKLRTLAAGRMARVAC